MVEKTAFENVISNFEGLLTLTLDQVILHTIMHHSKTSTCMPNFTESKKLLVYGWTYGQTDI